MGFVPGEFTGKVAENDRPFFHERLQPVVAYDKAFKNSSLQELPMVREAGENDGTANYKYIFWVAASGVIEGMKVTNLPH